MVSYEEQLARNQQTIDFVTLSNDPSLETQNELYRNLYNACLSDSRCNLDIFVAEHGLDPNKLDSSITTPIKYTELREVLAQREILLDAGYKLTNFDATTFDKTKSAKDQIQIISYPSNSGQSQPFDYMDELPNYDGLDTTLAQNSLNEAISFFTLHDTDKNTSTQQNNINNEVQSPVNEFNIEKENDSILGLNFDTVKNNATGIGIAIAAGIVGYAILRKKK